MSEEAKKFSWIRALLILLPVWLIASGVWALWYYFQLEEKEALVEQQRFSQAVSLPLLSDDLRKIVEVIGERNRSSEAAGLALSRTAAMIEGLLGPSNTGYAVKRVPGAGEWPLLHVTVQGKEPKSPGVWVISSYDSPVGSRGAEANATGLAATLAAAQATANDTQKGPIHFVFVPHANDEHSLRMETVGKVLELLGSVAPKAVLYVEAMGAGESLLLSSRDSTAVPLTWVGGLGEIEGAGDALAGKDLDFTSMLAGAGLPVVRVSTRAKMALTVNDARLPFPPTVAASSGRLIELIRRCATALPGK